MNKDKSSVLHRLSQNHTGAAAASQHLNQMSNITKTKPLTNTQTSLPQAVAAAQQSNKAWRDLLRTPILKVKKVPSSLVPVSKDPGA